MDRANQTTDPASPTVTRIQNPRRGYGGIFSKRRTPPPLEPAVASRRVHRLDESVSLGASFKPLPAIDDLLCWTIEAM